MKNSTDELSRELIEVFNKGSVVEIWSKGIY